MIKRFLFSALILVLLLSGCSVVGFNTPTPNPAVVQTRVAQVMTILPSPTSPEQALITPISSAEPTAEPVTATPEPTAVPEPTAAPTAEPVLSDYPADNLGEPTLNDAMDDPAQWPSGYTPFTEIFVSNGQLTLVGSSVMDGWRLSLQKAKNFFAEVDLEPQACSGADRYGLYFRVPNPESADQGYLFSLTCSGYYSLRKWDEPFYEMTHLIPWTESAEVNAGSNQPNKLGVLANGDLITLFINGQKVAEINDASYPEGYVGLFVGAQRTQFFTVKADNFRFWELP
ncbi:MAG TPA: hypothetical protein PKD55_25255 [Bellilinea sp.]|nr:hypothetical protein [Bellilinea sp.]